MTKLKPYFLHGKDWPMNTYLNQSKSTIQLYLGVKLDSSLSFNQHVMNTCRSAFLELRRIGLIRKYLIVDATKTIVCSLVLSRLDYCNSILSMSPKCLIQKLQRVQNTAARITLRMPRTEHTTPLLRMLHWLPIPSRIAYKIDSLCHTALTTAYPKYLSELLNVYTPARPLRSSLDPNILKILPQEGQSHVDSELFPTRDPSTGTGSLAALELWKKRTHSKDI